MSAVERTDEELGLTRSLVFMPAMVEAVLFRNKIATRRFFPFDPKRHAPAHWDGYFRMNEPTAPARHVTLRGMGVVRHLPLAVATGDRVLIKERFEVIRPRDPKTGMTKIRYATFWRKPYAWIESEALDVLAAPGWKSARFMPYAAARIVLRVTGVRIERLDAITDQDAIEEGIVALGMRYTAGQHAGVEMHGRTPRITFAVLWDVHHAGKVPPQAWKDNPWVSAIRFRVES